VVTASNITSAKVYVENFHAAPQIESVNLNPSKLLMQRAFDHFFHGTCTPAKFVAKYAAEIQEQGRPLNMSTLGAVSKRARRIRNGPATLSALSNLASKHPDRVYLLNMPDHGRKGQDFAFGITAQKGLDDAIRCGLEITGIDSSYRNFNTANAPITSLNTMDPVTRTVKIAAILVSGNIQTSTLSHFARWFQERVQDRAKSLLAMEPTTWPAKLRGLESSVRKCAEDGGFQPRIATTDLARNNHAAIREVFPDSFVRSCWWHLKECIKRWKWEGLVSTRRPEGPGHRVLARMDVYHRQSSARTNTDH
jgi:hypothetical protein